MIDFTANWCLNCQINTRVAIERPEVARVVENNKVIPMLADWTEPSDEIKQKLDELESNSIPLMAIYPADPNAEPIILRDLLTKSQVVGALEEAGPSLSPTEQARTTLTSKIH
jgi:thiol:disulfide interchange protein